MCEILQDKKKHIKKSMMRDEKKLTVPKYKMFTVRDTFYSGCLWYSFCEVWESKLYTWPKLFAKPGANEMLNCVFHFRSHEKILCFHKWLLEGSKCIIRQFSIRLLSVVALSWWFTNFNWEGPIIKHAIGSGSDIKKNGQKRKTVGLYTARD